MIIAIDGPAAAGKGTLARRIADHLGYAYLDTGKLYRAVGQAVVRLGGDPSNPAQALDATRHLSLESLSDPDLALETAGAAASRVAVHPEVRSALLEFQRSFAEAPPNGARGAVLDGRDIGTTVCPNADVKVFVTARAEVRARRRFLELKEKNLDVKESAVLQDLIERDDRDRTRATAPLLPAQDAVVLDTSDVTADGAFQALLAILARRAG